MKRRILSAFLSVLMILGSTMFFASATDDADVEILETNFTQKVLSAKANNYWGERKNYNSVNAQWDSETGIYYDRYISTGKNASDNLAFGSGSNVFYIGNWSIGKIPVSYLGNKVYIGMYVRTNSASKPHYQPLTLADSSGTSMSNNTALERYAESAFEANEEWEFNTIALDFTGYGVGTFSHGQLRFETEAGKYIDVAAWGIFAPTVSEEDAKTTLISEATVADSGVHTVEVFDTDDSTLISTSLINGKSITLPDFEDTSSSVFMGWTDTKDSYTVVAAGGANYKPTADINLYPVWVDNVRFVDETAAVNGNGYTPETPYNKFSLAAADLATTGGTIVVVGTYDITDEVTEEVVDESVFSTLNNTGDIVITSVYDGVDYREYGAKLFFSGKHLGMVDNPGKVTMTDINVTSTSNGNWHLNGHETHLTETCIIRDANNAALNNIQLIAILSTGGNYVGNTLPETFMTPLKVRIGNKTDIGSYFLGVCESITIGDADVVVDGLLRSLVISNNTWAKYWHGRLSIEGDVTVTVNGQLNQIIVKQGLTGPSDTIPNSTAENAPSLEKFDGNLSVIVNNGATFTGTIDDHIKTTANAWFIARTPVGASVVHGENGGDFVLTLDDGQDYNFVNLTNSTTSNTYSYFIDEGVSEFTLTESGDYTMTFSKNESKTISFVDAISGNTIDDMTTIQGLDITLPALENTETHKFLGWASTEGATEVEFEAGEAFTVSDDTTLYAVWSEAEVYTVTFMANGVEFDKFVGIEGKTITYPTGYPKKEGYYFQKWDKTPEAIGTEDIVISAVFVSKEDYGNVIYVDGTAADTGDGTIGNPLTSFKEASKAVAAGGTIVVIGPITPAYSGDINNTGDVLVTSLDPITGKNFMATITGGTVNTGYVSGGTVENGGYINQTSTFFFGNGGSGKIKFENIIISQNTYNCLTNAGSPIEIGENVIFHRKSYTTYFALSSSNSTVDPLDIKATIKSAITGSVFLSHTYTSTLSSVNIDFYKPVNTFNINANNGADSAVTLNGPMNLTIYEGGTGTKFGCTADRFAAGKSAYLSIVRNNATTTGTLPAVLADKTYDITVAANGTVTHTSAKGVYNVVSDTYNYAELIDAEGNVVDEAIIVGGGQLTAPAYGKYTVSFSDKEIYSAVYVTSPYDELCPDAYAVTSDETDKLTITLPTLDNQVAHVFKGWATTENSEVSEYVGGTEYTLAGEVTFYAVWETIPTSTVTFKNDGGETIHTVTGYVGSPLTFPEDNPYKYGEKLLGYAYEGTTDVLTEDAVIPSEDKVALPVWGAIPAGETRLYVNAATGSDDNTGISPDVALATIAKAVSLIKDDGGYIILTGGTNNLTGGWNNAGDITLTSLDPVTGINYKATTISQDKLSFTDGATVTYKALNFGDASIEGKITLSHLAMINPSSYQFINFNGHPYEIGEGITVNQQADASSEIVGGILYMRSLGEANSTKTLDDGLHFTLNTVSPNAVLKMLGKAGSDIPGVNLTVNTTYNGDLQFGNDSAGGIATVTGDSRFTFNAGTSKAMAFQGAWTNPIEGNVYAIFNNGVSVNLSALVFAEGYGLYQIHSGNKATLAHGEVAGTFELTLKDGYDYKFVKLLNSEGTIVDYVAISDGKANIALPALDTYTLDYTDVSFHKITFATGDESISISDAWYEDGTDIELPADLYRYGYTFGGWSDGETTYEDGLITMPDKDITLTALWTVAPEYTITFDANGSDITVPDSVTDYVNENIVLESKKSEDATFVGWSEDPDGTVGVLNHVIEGDTTLYAITTTEPVYIIDSHFRGDPDDYTGPRCQFRRYVIDVYLENAVASSGSFKLNTDNNFLYYLGHVPVIGIDAKITAQNTSGTVAGMPGLGYSFSKNLEVKWTSDAPVDATNGRRRIARIMMYFGVWGMGYSEIESRTTDEVVSPYAGYTALAGQDTALVTANFYKGVKGDEVKLTGKVTLEGRDRGDSAKYDYAKLYILDSEGDAVEYIVLENEDSSRRTFNYTTNILPGDYTLRVIKSGYATRNIPFTVTQSGEAPDVVLFAGDTVDESGKSDGVVDIDDFVKILRGFANDFPINNHMNVFDVNEDGMFNVADVAVVKSNLSMTIADDAAISSSVDRTYKLANWSIVVEDDVITVKAGSQSALENALAYLEEECHNGSKYVIPSQAGHFEDYELSEINVGDKSIGDYRIVIAEGDEVAAEYAQYVYDYIAEVSGYGLDIVYDSEQAVSEEIIIGATSRRANPVTQVEKYETYEEDGKFYVFYGDEQSAEMACLDLCEKILGKDSEGFDGDSVVTVTGGQKQEGEWTVLTRFGVMSDTHVGVGKKWANYDWLHSTFANFEKIHAENPLDFMVSLGDNIDDGYTNTYATDYAIYLEEMKNLDICDPVNPIDGRAEGMIPHYEICGNHDPIADQLDSNGDLKIRFFKNKLWYTENENGEKVAHIAFFTDYGGYPLYNVEYSGSTESYRSYGKANDEMVKFVEDSIIEANAEGAVHIILYNHYGIAQDLGAPVLPETGLKKIADVCEKYGIKLFFNGHEHDNYYTLRRYNDIYDYDCSMTATKHSVVEITTLRAKVTIYNKDGSVYRQDIVPLSGRGEAKQTFAK